MTLIKKASVWAISIIGILIVFSLFLPPDGGYSDREKVSEGVQLAGSAKSAVSEYYASKGVLPTSNLSVGLPVPASIRGNNVASIAIQSSPAGAVLVTYSGNADTLQGKTLLLIPTTRGGYVTWSCSDVTTSTLLPKYRPSSCRP